MAKLTVVAAIFLALIAGASAYTTVVTTSVMDEKNPEESCEREIQQMTRMRHCVQWMKSGRPYLRSAVGNQECCLEECCEELRNFSPECRCDGIRHVMMQAQQQYGMEEQMMRQRAQSLPRMCNMSSPTECHFKTVFA